LSEINYYFNALVGVNKINGLSNRQIEELIMKVLRTLLSRIINPVRKRWNFLNILLWTIDSLSIALAFQFAYFINNFRTGGFFFTERYMLALFISILPIWIIILYLIKFTQIPTKRYKVLIIIYLHASLMVLSFLILFCYMFDLFPIPLNLLMEISFLGFILLFLVRTMEYGVFKNFAKKRHIHKKVVMIADDSSIPFIENLLSKQELAYKVVVIFTQSDLVKKRYEDKIIILPEKYSGILIDLIEVDLIDEVLFLKDKGDPAEVRETVATCEELGVTFRMPYNSSKVSLSSAIRTNFANGNYLSFINIPYHSYALAIRKTMDINMALLIIVIFLPLLALIGILIKLTSPGPAICKKESVGGKGRPIMLYKFRTHLEEAEGKWINIELKNSAEPQIPEFKEGKEVTKIGNFLIKSGLDQLPQLFNVLRGELAVIGPRSTLHSEKLQQLDN
jgi:lipopolysaccharide/colanic/teichoic acid biosynthesis glycosyltransferase